MQRTAVFFVAVAVLACGKKPPAGGADGGDAATASVTLASPTSPLAGEAGARRISEATPAEAPAFLERFCDAVAKADQAYIDAHKGSTPFSSSQGPDPEARQSGKRGRSHGGPVNYGPVCERIRAQPAAEIRKRVREEDGFILVRLRHDGLASDVVLERNGADFRLLREERPKPPPGRGGGGHGGH